jgi:hypothetical protein
MYPGLCNNSVMVRSCSASRTQVELTLLARIRYFPALGAVLLAATCASGQTPGPSRDLKIVVLEGNGAINNIAAQKARDPIVKVVDGDGAPVANATVTFTLPSSGPGGAFLDGQKSTTVRTAPDGTAATHGLKPNKTAGQFEIRVVASAGPETARASVMQTNAMAAGEKSHAKAYVILAVIAAGAAGGAIAATHGGSSSAAPPAAAAASGAGGAVVPGSPSFGPPR